MTTIQDVAKKARVSSTTVSRVLNSSNAVNPDTRNIVLKVIEKLNYQPNHFSQNLRRRQSRMLLILLPDFANPFYGEILDGMDEEARLGGYNLLQVSTYSEPIREREALAWLESKQAAGAVFMAPSLPSQEMEQANDRFKIVQCCEYLKDSSIAHVSIDNYKAAHEAVEHLIRIGHKRIAMFSSTNNFISTEHRERAYRDALIGSGLEYDERLLLRGSYSFESGLNNVRRILSMKMRPTAITAVSDAVAAGAVRGILDAGLNIPKDIAIMGFDNIELARMITPPLSTVAQPLRMLGKTAVQMLVNKLDGATIQNEVYLPFEIVLRKSTL